MLKVGSTVHTTDGQAGKLTQVVFDPETERVTHLIVERGFLQRIDRVVPLEAVGESGEDGINLNISTAELEALPQFNETEFRRPDPGWEHERFEIDDPAHVLNWGIHKAPVFETEYTITREEEFKSGVDTDDPVIGKGTAVYDRDGKVGEVSELQFDEESGVVTHLVVSRGLFGGHLTVPISSVSSISDTGVSINLNRDQIEEESATAESPEVPPVPPAAADADSDRS